MLSREQAAAALKDCALPNWQSAVMAAIKRDLSRRLHAVVCAIFSWDEAGDPLPRHDYEAYKKALDEAHLRLAELSPEERERVFLTLFPGPGKAVAAGWELQRRLPYQTGWQRLPFRLALPPRAGGLRALFPGVDAAVAHDRARSVQAQQEWLTTLAEILGQYRQQPASFFAQWAPYLTPEHSYVGGVAAALGRLCAGAIEAGGDDGESMAGALIAATRGEGPVPMGRQVIGGLLCASYAEGWAAVERLLLAASREEGLRQSILEASDFAHPLAFRRMLCLIDEANLLRFAATVRAIAVWLGAGWEVDDARALHDALRTVTAFLDDLGAREQALRAGPAHHTYFALWATAFEDAREALERARALLADGEPTRRLAAVYLLGRLGLPEARPALLASVSDPDLRVALCALHGLEQGEDGWGRQPREDLFAPVEGLLGRLPERAGEVPSGLWPWLSFKADAGHLIDLLVRHRGTRSPIGLLRYLPRMSPYSRSQFAAALGEVRQPPARAALLDLGRDKSSDVRTAALEALGKHSLGHEDILALEGSLTRKSADLRRGVLTILLKQRDGASLESARRLLAHQDERAREAGREIALTLLKSGRAEQGARALLAAAGHDSALAAAEQRVEPTIANAFGLCPGIERTPVRPPRPLPPFAPTPAALACLTSLDALVAAHLEQPLTLAHTGGRDEALFGNLGAWQLPAPDAGLSADDDVRRLPLADLWLSWQRERPPALRDTDGQELHRALLVCQGALPPCEALSAALAGAGVEKALVDDLADLLVRQGHERAGSFFGWGLHDADNPLVKALTRIGGRSGKLPEKVAAAVAACQTAAPSLARLDLVAWVVNWLVRLEPAAIQGAAVDLALDALEAALGAVRPATIDLSACLAREARRAREKEAYRFYGHAELPWRDRRAITAPLSIATMLVTYFPAACTAQRDTRFWHLDHYLDQPHPEVERRFPDLQRTLAAWKAGAANLADLYDQLIGPAASDDMGHYGRLRDLTLVTRSSIDALEAAYPGLQAAVAPLKERIVEIEAGRGELPTVATPLALALPHSGGAELFARLVALLEPTDLARATRYAEGEARATVLSHLLRATEPQEGDTPEFEQAARAARLGAARLVGAAVYAPQWAGRVEHYLDWPGLADAVWWIHAHTKDRGWASAERQAVFAAEVATRTPLGADDLLDGAVDVAWFRRAYSALGDERWRQVYAAAKYASSSNGHGRARLFADAMLGRVGEDDLAARIAATRHQDAVRALGLLPLGGAAGPGSTEGHEDLARRYATIAAFERASRTQTAGRRASEEVAVRIGYGNLARTAGYADAARLQWAMEARGGGEEEGPAEWSQGDMRVWLEVATTPRLVVERKGKPLASLPSSLKKVPEVMALQARRKAIAEQVARVRPTLEQAMCRGDGFSESELAGLLWHRTLGALVGNLVFVAPLTQAHQLGNRHTPVGSSAALALGYPVVLPGGGVGLRRHDGVVVPLADLPPDTGLLRVAHPHDLWLSGQWHLYQAECFASERVQPVRQIFRELYLLSGAEAEPGATRSERYSGHQVQPQQARALLAARGWLGRPDDGEVARTFHAEGLTATLSFGWAPFTPAEVEGLTIESVQFSRRGGSAWQPVPLVEVPPRLFSEAMRDLDLVVSVAHRGGVDPEATASTVEMRAALVRETCAMLRLDGVEVAGRHALIQGTLGRYSVHLGSGTVHRQPGGAVCIVPVHAQQRGRIFLPFADDDPRSAEVLSKVILLARDAHIKDPTILEQISCSAAWAGQPCSTLRASAPR